MTTEATVTLPISPADYAKRNNADGTKCCPHCNSESVDYGSVDCTKGEYTQVVFCHDCGAEWEDVYTMTGYRTTKLPD